MKRAIFCGIIICLIVMSGCSGGKSEDGKSEVKVVFSQDLASYPDRAGVDQSGQELHSSYDLVLTVSGSDLNSPLVFVNENYQMGSEWTVYVPNGNGRVFDLIVYVIPDIPAGTGYFYLDMYRPSNPEAERTYNLNGSPLSISIPLERAPVGYVGSGSGSPASTPIKGTAAAAGFQPMLMNTGGGRVAVPQCPFTLQAYLIDVAAGLTFGPALIDMSGAGMPGYWSLGNVPVGRNYQLKIGRPEMGWSGLSGIFMLPDEDLASRVLAVVLNGFKSLSIEPKNFLVKDGDTTFTQQIRASGGWGVYSFYTSLMYGATIVAKNNDAIYRVTGILYSDTVDNINIYDDCAMGAGLTVRPSEAARSQSSLNSRAWWYKAPKIGSYYPIPINFMGGDYVSIYGDNFDGTYSPGPLGPSQLFLDGTEYDLQYGSTYFLEFISPAKPKGEYPLRVLNPRNNSLFPDFKGFSDQIQVEYGEGGAW